MRALKNNFSLSDNTEKISEPFQKFLFMTSLLLERACQESGEPAQPSP